ncbi:CSTA [Bugula neritina]|uniref:CSTA n=1 Tax=Bugula neritina TaxID=10212 RepID=A0A7J7KS09_BUGNE|nr:CSTA [Bugula neritina]
MLDNRLAELVFKFREEFERMAGTPFNHYVPISYRIQIVAGSNNFVKIQVFYSDCIHAKIYLPLAQSNELPRAVGVQINKSLGDVIEPF